MYLVLGLVSVALRKLFVSFLLQFLEETSQAGWEPPAKRANSV